MSALLLPYATALLLGTLHALEADHVAAVTSFAVRRPGIRSAVRFGVRWSLGHGGTILVVGTVLILLATQLPAASTRWLERLVGAVMIGLGVWTIRGAAALHAHSHTHADGVVHAHLHSHAIVDDHGHAHAATVVGLLHGFAGSGAAVALIPVAGFDSALAGIFFLVVFGAGTIAGMAVYGLLAGFVAGRTADRSVRLARLLARVTGGFTMIVGFVWLLR
ncbi:MAG: sulfite exporter TauE/SafE family protein [Gemmatimonadota bacterium]